MTIAEQVDCVVSLFLFVLFPSLDVVLFASGQSSSILKMGPLGSQQRRTEVADREARWNIWSEPLKYNSSKKFSRYKVLFHFLFSVNLRRFYCRTRFPVDSKQSNGQWLIIRNLIKWHRQHRAELYRTWRIVAISIHLT